MLTEKSFDTGELVINYAEGETAAPPLVLLHGSTMCWQRMGQFIPTLEQHWHVYACDLRGHGMSRWARSGYRLNDFALDTTAFLERCVGRPVVLVGYSFGAQIALVTAARLPHLARALVLLEAPLFRGVSMPETGWLYETLCWMKETLANTRTLAEVAARCREHDSISSDEEIEDLAARLHRLDPELLDYGLDDRSLEGVDFEQLLPKVTCPTLLVHGEPAFGSLVRESDVTLFQECVPHVVVIQIKGAGHSVVRDAPGQMALAHVTRFLDAQQ